MTSEELNTKMNGESLDIAEQRKRELAQLFPEIFTETFNDSGDLVTSVDFTRLKTELGEFADVFENHRERYGMNWPGKKEAQKLIQEPSRATLKPCREESIDFDNTENLFIEGDNLEVLKILQKSYYGKVKMIYIDPPYNTGNEFIYPDKYSENLETYLAYAGLVDNEGRKFSTNTASEGRFHTKWLNMMYPRLYLARNLLTDNGVIFISIDDNELENLKKLCNEIFGEENFKTDITWQKRYTRSNNTVDFTTVTEHILVYSKSDIFQVNLLPRSEEADARYTNPDDDPRGAWKGASFLNPASPQERPNLCYTIVNPNTRKETVPTTNAWRRSQSEFIKLQHDNKLYWGKDGKSSVPSIKMFLSEARGLTPTNFWAHDYAGNTDDGTKDLEKLIPGKVFDNPKPVQLIKRVMEHCLQEDSIILDFFCGSGTLPHAVLDYNTENSTKHRFIAVQLPEICNEQSNAFKHKFYKISDISKERIRKAISYREANLKGSSKDKTGFRVFKLDKSCFKEWHTEVQISENKLQTELSLFIDHIDTKVSQEDILYELLLKAGFEPTEHVETLSITNKTVFSIAGGALLIYLGNKITSELIDAIVEMKPMQFICLDKAFHGNDQLKANAIQTFASLNQGRDKYEQIRFRTV